MFQFLTPTTAKLKSLTPRIEKHGDENVPAVSLGLSITGPNTLLDLFPEMLAALQHVEAVYRLNVVKDGEPSSTLANLQAVIAKATEIPAPGAAPGATRTLAASPAPAPLAPSHRRVA